MDTWITTAIVLYKELGERGAIQVLYNAEKDSVQVLNKREGTFCPVCGKRLFTEDYNYCPECGNRIIYSASESVWYDLNQWIPASVSPSEKNKYYLICNVFGEKYLLNYNIEKKNFDYLTEEEKEEALGYMPVDEEQVQVLSCLCSRVNCKNCKNIVRENGVLRCPYEKICGNHRYNEAVPKYKVPQYKEQ